MIKSLQIQITENNKTYFSQTVQELKRKTTKKTIHNKMFHLQRFFSMEQAATQNDDGGDESLSGVGGETDSTSAEG